jgi:hypothetical protein
MPKVFLSLSRISTVENLSDRSTKIIPFHSDKFAGVPDEFGNIYASHLSPRDS